VAVLAPASAAWVSALCRSWCSVHGPPAQQALEWIHQQRGRLAEGIGLSFAIADAESDSAVGAIGLWLQSLSAGRATAGYAVSPCTEAAASRPAR
jgi:ribosomal protein S12 methylthiotransferase accessory factor YcaO